MPHANRFSRLAGFVLPVIHGSARYFPIGGLITFSGMAHDNAQSENSQRVKHDRVDSPQADLSNVARRRDSLENRRQESVDSFSRYWGKAKSDIQDGPQYHLLPYHCLDVGLGSQRRVVVGRDG